MTDLERGIEAAVILALDRADSDRERRRTGGWVCEYFLPALARRGLAIVRMSSHPISNVKSTDGSDAVAGPAGQAAVSLAGAVAPVSPGESGETLRSSFEEWHARECPGLRNPRIGTKYACDCRENAGPWAKDAKLSWIPWRFAGRTCREVWEQEGRDVNQ